VLHYQGTALGSVRRVLICPVGIGVNYEMDERSLAAQLAYTTNISFFSLLRFDRFSERASEPADFGHSMKFVSSGCG